MAAAMSPSDEHDLLRLVIELDQKVTHLLASFERMARKVDGEGASGRSYDTRLTLLEESESTAKGNRKLVWGAIGTAITAVALQLMEWLKR